MPMSLIVWSSKKPSSFIVFQWNSSTLCGCCRGRCRLSGSVGIRRLRCHLRLRRLQKSLGLSGKTREKLLERVNRRETWSSGRGKKTSSPSSRVSRMSCSGPGHTTQSTMIRAERKSCFQDTWLGAIKNFFRWDWSRLVQISSCFCLVRMVILFCGTLFELKVPRNVLL